MALTGAMLALALQGAAATPPNAVAFSLGAERLSFTPPEELCPLTPARAKRWAQIGAMTPPGKTTLVVLGLCEDMAKDQTPYVFIILWQPSDRERLDVLRAKLFPQPGAVPCETATFQAAPSEAKIDPRITGSAGTMRVQASYACGDGIGSYWVQKSTAAYDHRMRLAMTLATTNTTLKGYTIGVTAVKVADGPSDDAGAAAAAKMTLAVSRGITKLLLAQTDSGG